MRVAALLIALLLAACGSETRQLHFDFEPLPYGEKPLLTFSGAQPDSSTPATKLSAGLVDASNQVWLLSDGLDLMVFDFPAWNGKRVGLPRPATAPAQPEQLAEGPQGMLVTWPDVGQLSAQDADSWRLAPMPVAGARLSRSGDWLLQLDSSHWQRRDQTAQTHDYTVAEESHCVSADRDGSFAALSRQGLLECFDASGTAQLRIRLPQERKSARLSYQALQRLNERLYVLYRAGEGGGNYLLVLDLRGTVRHHWSLPLPCDYFDSNGKLLLMLDRQATRAYVLPLER